MIGSLEGDTFVGPKAQEHRGLLKINYPVSHGVVTNWDDMERVWSYLYRDELRIESEEHPVLLTEAPLNPRGNREKAAQILFETFNAPALNVYIQAVLAIFAAGRGSGLVIDSGDGVTHAVPVSQGFVIQNAIQRIDVAGCDVTDHLQLLLRKAGISLQTSAEREIVREIKEKMCYLALDPRREEKEWINARIDRMNPLSTLTTMTTQTQTANATKTGTTGPSEITNPAPNTLVSTGPGSNSIFRLPDGRVLDLGAERFRAPEILFNPEIIGSESPGIHEVIDTCIQRTDIDLRLNFYSNIILSGGTTLTNGFGARLLDELRKMGPPNRKISIVAPPDRKYLTWIGGSILGSLSIFQKTMISADEWHENPDIIHTNCL